MLVIGRHWRGTHSRGTSFGSLDHISLGVIARTFPLSAVRAALVATGKESVRQRDLPAQVVVCYVATLALSMQSSHREVLRCLIEGVHWLDRASTIKVAGGSGIFQARTRLGWVSMRALHDAAVKQIVQKTTKGAWYRDWRLVSLEGCRPRRR